MPQFMKEAASYQYKYPVQVQSPQKSSSNTQNNKSLINNNQNTNHYNRELIMRIKKINIEKDHQLIEIEIVT